MSVPCSIRVGVTVLLATLALTLPFISLHAEVTPAQVSTASTTASETQTQLTSISSTTETVEVIPVALVQRPYQTEMITGNNIQAGDFVVGPGRIEVSVKPGETVVRNMTVTNRVSGGRTFKLAVEDMSGSADPTQSVVLLGDQKGPYTLKDNISFASPEFSLELGERAVVPISITMPPNAEPGGYYGAVLVSTVQEGSVSNENNGAQSPLISRIGTLFFITVPGNSEVSSQIKDFATKNNQWWFEKGPISMSILYENTGSVHLNPYGEINITNMFGGDVGFVEVDPWFILPKSLRLREVSWDREFLFGRYAITAKINRGYDNVIDEKVMYIWVLPWKILLGIFVSLFVLISLVRFFFKSFEFKRKG